MKNELEKRMSVFRVRYQVLMYSLTIIPLISCVIAALWLGLKAGTAMGVTIDTPGGSHPNESLCLLNMFSLLVGGLAIGALIGMRLHILMQCPYHNWSWNKAKDVIEADAYPKHWYNAETTK